MIENLESLIAIEEIKQLKARYFRYMDMQQWDKLATVWAEDAVYDATDALRNGSGDDTLDQKLGDDWINTGRDNIVRFIAGALDMMQSAHHGHMPEITIQSPTSASAIWPMSDVVRRVVDGRVVLKLEGEGHYWETYVKVGDKWQIKTSRLTRLRTSLWQADEEA